MPARTRRIVVAASFLLGACTGDYYSKDADREVSGVLDEFNGRGLGDRAARLRMPAVKEPVSPNAEVGEPQAQPTAPEPQQPPLRLDLKTTLSIAVAQSREFKDARESLYLQGLGFTFTRFQYGPQFDSSVSYVWGDAENTHANSAAAAGLSVSQLLPTNGTVSVSGGITKSWIRRDTGSNDDWSTVTAISLTQPLLRGGGYQLYRESLTQGERNLVYAVRSFELFREQFTIDRTRDFFGLVGQKRKLDNRKFDLDAALFDEEKNVELRKVDRVLDKDVISARRRRLQVESDIADARTQFDRSVQSFLIDIGLDPRTPVELVEEEPPYDIINFEPHSAVDVAMQNRLDVQTQHDLLDDAERHFQLARNDLLPDMNLTASYGSNGDGQRPISAFPGTWARGGSVSLEIPLQTIDRRNRWRQAEIEIARTRRDWDRFVDDVKSGLEDQIRQIATTERQIEISEQSIKDEEDNTEIMAIRLEQGSADARDLTESRQSLLNARNNLVDQKVSHLIQQLSLYRNLGILFIGRDGSWSVGAPAQEDVR
jgi:outer membrane protein TolC